MKEKVHKTKVVKSWKITCDICKNDTQGDGEPCGICGRDVCDECRVWWYKDLWLTGDVPYPVCMCRKCNEKAKPFLEKGVQLLMTREGLGLDFRRACREGSDE